MLKKNDYFPGYVEGIEGLKSCPYVPFDPQKRFLYNTYIGSAKGQGVQPWEYTGWRDECASWHDNCYLHTNLNPHPTYIIEGPDALQVASDYCVNSVKDWPIGKGKHLILCDENGIVINDGVAVRIRKDAIKTHELSRLSYQAEKGNYDVKVTNLTFDETIFQLCGPKALEVVENAVEEDLHDIAFMYTKVVFWQGIRIGIIRMGMGGTLAYELHMNNEDAIAVYNKIMEAGKSFGLRNLGSRAYIMTHYECGFPQWSLDFPSPWGNDDEYMAYLKENGFPGREPAGGVWANEYTRYEGSVGEDLQKRLRNPVELGWGPMIKFDHEFMGRKALEVMMEKPSRQMVTLDWNKEDILDVHRSQFEQGEPYKNLDNPIDFRFEGPYTYHADMVLKDGKEIGISTGRMNSFYYREMISICSIDTEYADIGTEVAVLWGEPGTRQKEIRAVVARFPYYDENRNQTFDVETIPHYRKG